MRIISGSLRGRRLVGRPAKGTRPTSDRVREGIASALESRAAFADASVLDLYAGTGALGFEALSRGAVRLCAVESDRAALRCIEQNAAALGLTERTRVLGLELSSPKQTLELSSPKQTLELSSSEPVLERIASSGFAPFNLVFADPPYTLVQDAVRVLERLAARGLVAAEAWLVVEHATRSAPGRPAAFAERASYRYGDSSVVLWQAIAASG